MEDKNLMNCLEMALKEMESETTCMTQEEIDEFVESIQGMQEKRKIMSEKYKQAA